MTSVLKIRSYPVWSLAHALARLEGKTTDKIVEDALIAYASKYDDRDATVEKSADQI